MVDIDSRSRAYEWIKGAIESGAFEEGQPLGENFLAKEIGVSRTPIREALRLLERANYVRIVPTKGAFVSEISINDVKEIYDIRKLLEPFAAASAVYRVPKDEILSIEKEWTAMAEGDAPVEWGRVSELDFRFHIMIMNYSSNRRIRDIIASYHSQIMRFQLLSAKFLSDIKDTIRQHLELLDSLKRRDINEFPALLLEHIIKSEENIRRCG